MGTRADFYVGKGKDAQWVGSIAWDGYREGIDEDVLRAQSEEAFRANLAKFFKGREDVTLPAQGWPWPWETSDTTDCSYWFFGDQVWDVYENQYWSCLHDDPGSDDDVPGAVSGGTVDFPDMSAIKNVTLGPRSGVIVVSV